MKKTYKVEVDCANCAARWKRQLRLQQELRMQH